MPRHRSATAYFRDRNFMTPDRIETGFKGRYAYELSSGEFCRLMLYGVTLADRATGESCHEESRSFDDLAAARSYIANLAN